MHWPTHPCGCARATDRTKSAAAVLAALRAPEDDPRSAALDLQVKERTLSLSPACAPAALAAWRGRNPYRFPPLHELYRMRIGVVILARYPSFRVDCGFTGRSVSTSGCFA